MTDAEEFDDERDDQPRYRAVAEIGTSDLYEALISLAGFAEILTLRCRRASFASSTIR